MGDDFVDRVCDRIERAVMSDGVSIAILVVCVAALGWFVGAVVAWVPR